MADDRARIMFVDDEPGRLGTLEQQFSDEYVRARNAMLIPKLAEWAEAK